MARCLSALALLALALVLVSGQDAAAVRLAATKHLNDAQLNMATMQKRLLAAQTQQTAVSTTERQLGQELATLQQQQELSQTQLSTLTSASAARERLRKSVQLEVESLSKQLRELQQQIRKSRDKEMELLNRALERGVSTRALGDEQSLLLHEVSELVRAVSDDKTALQAANTTLGEVESQYSVVQEEAERQHRLDLDQLAIITKQRKAAAEELAKQAENRRSVDIAAARIRESNVGLVKAVDEVLKRREGIIAKRDSLKRSVILLNVVVRQLAEAVKAQRKDLADAKTELERTATLEKQRANENEGLASFTKKLDAESGDLTNKVKGLTESLPLLEERLTNITRLRDAFAASLASVKQQVLGEEAIVENLKAARTKLRAHLLVAKSRIAALQRDVKRLADKVKDKTADKKDIDEEMPRLIKRTKTILGKIGNVQAKLEDAEGKAKAAWLRRRGECQCDELQFAGASESAIAACMRECSDAVVVAEATLLELSSSSTSSSVQSEEEGATLHHHLTAGAALSEAVSRSRDALRSSLAGSSSSSQHQRARTNPFRFAAVGMDAESPSSSASSTEGAAEERQVIMRLSELSASLTAAGVKVNELLASTGSSSSSSGSASGSSSLPATVDRLARKVGLEMKTAEEEKMLLEALRLVADPVPASSSSHHHNSALPRFASAGLDADADAETEAEEGSGSESGSMALSRADLLSSGDPIAAMTEAEARSIEAKTAMLKKEVEARESEIKETQARVIAMTNTKQRLAAAAASLQKKVQKAQYEASLDSGDLFSASSAAAAANATANAGAGAASSPSASPSASPSPPAAASPTTGGGSAVDPAAATSKDPLVQAAAQQSAVLRSSIELLSKQLEGSVARVTSMKTALQAADGEFERLTKDIDRLKRTKAALDNQKANLARTVQTTLKAIRTRKADIMKGQDDLKASRDAAARERAKARELLDEATREAQSLAQYYDFMTKANAALTVHVDALRSRKDNLMSSEEAINKEIADADATLQKIQTKQTDLLAATAGTAKLLTDTKADLAKVNAALAADEMQRGKLHQENQDAALRRDKLRSDQLHFQEKVSALRRQLLSQLKRTKDVNATLAEAKADLSETLRMRRALINSTITLQKGLKEANATMAVVRSERAASETLLTMLTQETQEAKDLLLKKRSDLRKTMASYRELLSSATHNRHVDLSIHSKSDVWKLMTPDDKYEEKRAVAEAEAKMQGGTYEPSEQWKEVLGAASDLLVEEDAPPMTGEPKKDEAAAAEAAQGHN